MMGLSYDGLIPILVATLILLLLLPFLWLKVGKWQKRLGLVNTSKITYALAVLFVLLQILLFFNDGFDLLGVDIKNLLVILALPVNVVMLVISAIGTYLYAK